MKTSKTNRTRMVYLSHWRTIWAVLSVIVLAVSVTAPALAIGAVGTAAGFEDDDGNLAPQAPINFDWNSFAATTWTGTAPYRQSDKIVSGWAFKGIEDAQVTTSDTAFAGGVKQDDNCASVGTGKAPNKDDLKRIYLATKNVGGRTYLMLAWVRIPQNTTSASAHIGFEFNKGSTPCGPSSDGLVHRTAGDVLIVYDFEGSSTDTPEITLRRWVTSGACEVGSVNPPCWGTATNLTDLGFAEAKVNTSDVGPVTDLIAPSPPETLGLNEFGEAGIDLTGAGVFEAGTCASFGKAFGVSRSSGNSGTAQMKDLVGPADFTLANCGTVIIHKVTDPAGDTTTDFGYTTDVTTTPSTTTSPFSLKDGETNTIVNVNPGTYSVIEDDPSPNYALADIDCSASTTAVTPTEDEANLTASFTIAAGETAECTFTNKLEQGAIKVTKTRKHAADGSGDHPHAGVSFTVNGVTKQTDSNGVACFDGLTFGTYTVNETVPAGYVVDANDKQVTVDNSATCSDNPYGGETVSFHNTPLSEIQVIFSSLAGPGATNASIECESSTGTVDAVSENGDPDPALDDTDETFTNLLPDTYVCTIVVDP